MFSQYHVWQALLSLSRTTRTSLSKNVVNGAIDLLDFLSFQFVRNPRLGGSFYSVSDTVIVGFRYRDKRASCHAI